MEGITICSYENSKASAKLKEIIQKINIDSNYEITCIKFEKQEYN